MQYAIYEFELVEILCSISNQLQTPKSKMLLCKKVEKKHNLAKMMDLVPMTLTYQNGHTLQFWIPFSES